ncbi:MAG: hypothetical protein OEV73_11920 [Desulfobulbaceae bacterium]|nr:hypothetical protein [Desulfobulbaceae bacterium]
MKTTIGTGKANVLIFVMAALSVAWFGGAAEAVAGDARRLGGGEYKRYQHNVNAGFRHDGDTCVVDELDGQTHVSALTIAPDSFTYSVTGTGCGHSVYGVIDVDGVGGVSGYLYLENGQETPFYGDWVGDGVAEGVDNNGNLYTLKVDN